MEDDIDIEEHDVLDNPKIRDIFPDLSLVKVEVPDEDIQDPVDLYEDYTPELRYDECDIKQENISDDENNTINSHEQNEQISQFEQSEISNFDLSEENVYQTDEDLSENQHNVYEDEQIEQMDMSTEFSNKIILGTKKIDYDILYEEALHSNTKVQLENWEFKLKNSQCYCENCEILFPTVNALDAHNSTSHSLLIALDIKTNTARKSTVSTSTSSTYCNHCDKTFPNDTALITHLYKLLPLSNYQKPPAPVEDFKYKCVKCVKYFDNYANASRHKKMAHSNLINVNTITIVKIPNNVMEKSGLSKPTLEKKYGKFFASSNLVPKSVVFQCNVCQVGFVSCYSALQHSRKCVNKTVYSKCRVCKRKIRSKDLFVHSLQHKYTDKLKIYTINKTIHERVLLKCPKCKICYDEKTFWLHEKDCQGTQPNYLRCNFCSINIISTRYEYHKNSHELQKYAKKDFIFVEFHDKNDINIQSVDKEEDTLPNEFDTTLYYCSCCGSYKTNSTTHGHANGGCKQLKIKFCELCGLGFGRQTFYAHKMLHKTKKICLNDFKIFSLETGEPIETPISNFHYCEYCMIHFLTLDALSSHSCQTEEFEMCEICDKKFNLKAFKPHSGFHTLEDLPELIKKYNSMKVMWNVIYSCEECDLVTMSYDSAVEHSQAHINDIVFPSSNYCKICNFNILEKDLKPHMNLHKNNESLNRNEFTILKYNYKNLFNSEWMNMLASLPKQHKYQILSKSIYRYTRRFKLNCEINCKTDEIKLFCNKCKTVVNMVDMKKHYASTCKYSTKYTCSTCKLKYKNLDECILHESEHYTEPKIYKVLTYNDEKDEIFNQKLKDFEPNNSFIDSNKSINKDSKPKFTTKLKTKMTTVKSKSMKFGTKIKLKKPAVIRSKVRFNFDSVKASIEREDRFKLYKCENCRSCLCLRKNVLKHKCVDKSRKKLCRICNELFHSRHLQLHMSYHKSFPKLNKSKPLIIYFNPNKSLNIATIFQCKCGLNFTTRQAIDKHFNMCDDNVEISKETCSKCNLLFPTDLLVSHLCKHHSKPVDIKIEKVEKKEQGPYKCASCKVVYQNINNFEYHLFSCPVKNGKMCSDCQYLIDSKTFSDHKCEKNVSVVKFNGIASTLFRCPTCNMTYLFKKSFCYHLEVNHVNQREIVTCNICHLRFTGQTINKHNSLVHNKDENFIIKLFEPETDKFTILKGRNYKLDFKSPAVKKVSEINRPKQKVATKKTVEETPPETSAVPGSKSYGRVWKCSACDICYLNKKRWHYHGMIINHKMKHKREIVPCDICGLRFAFMFLAQHKQIHETKESYSIEVIDPETRKINIITGKNKIKPNNKRKLNSIQNTVESKKAKTDLVDQKASTSKSVLTDNTPKRRARRSEYFADKGQSPSKIDFETVDMKEDTTMLSDVDTTDPLNNSVECLTDNSTADKEISNKLKNMLNAKFDVYSNTLYKCAKCYLHFLTKKSLFGHMNRDCGRRMITKLKCDICNHEFTWKTLPRHKYVHHTKMKLEPELLNIELVSEDDKFSSNQRKTSNDISISEKSKINYYKCADCNVCFVDENACKKHCISHVALDPKDYIECKICNFQFLIEYLKKHVHVHHNVEFFIEDLVITEYKPTEYRQPKIVVYRGIDKVQSRLVSTTTDAQADNSDISGDITGI